jgi:Holliday junction resolvasome RuvABC endonuclease subunit
MKERHERVLALHPTASGFGWAAFEGADHPVDWGVSIIRRDQNAASLARVARLIEKLHPSVIAVEKFEGPDSRRQKRVQVLYRSILLLARAKKVSVNIYSRNQIKTCFAHAERATRYEIARDIASRVEAFASQLPPQRKIWLPDDPRMGLFNAAAVALTHYWLVAKVR